MEECAKGDSKNRKSNFCGSLRPHCRGGGDALGGKHCGGKEGEKASLWGNNQTPGEKGRDESERSQRGGRVTMGSRSEVLPGHGSWLRPEALLAFVRLRAPGVDSSARRWQAPRRRPPNKDQLAAVPPSTGKYQRRSWAPAPLRQGED